MCAYHNTHLRDFKTFTVEVIRKHFLIWLRKKVCRKNSIYKKNSICSNLETRMAANLCPKLNTKDTFSFTCYMWSLKMRLGDEEAMFKNDCSFYLTLRNDFKKDACKRKVATSWAFLEWKRPFLEKMENALPLLHLLFSFPFPPATLLDYFYVSHLCALLPHSQQDLATQQN